MKFFALEMHREMNSSDGGPDWNTANLRLGGYKVFSRALSSLKKKSKYGLIMNEHREVVCILSQGRVQHNPNMVNL